MLIRLKLSFLTLGTLLLAAGSYVPGLSGGFLFDDYANITANAALRMPSLNLQDLWHASQSGNSGLLGRPLSMASFALNYALTGDGPLGFKLTNLAIHLTTGGALAVLAVVLLSAPALALSPGRKRAMAALTAAIWLLHPFNLTAVLYVVQRMTSLSALFVVLGCLAYASARLCSLRGTDPWPRLLLAVFVCGPLAAFSKENGVLLYPLLLLIEATLFRFEAGYRLSRKGLVTLHAITVALPAALALLSLALAPGFLLGGYANRDFTAYQRLLTESHVLVWYLRMLFVPDIGQMALLHDGFALSKSLLDPPATLAAVLLLVSLAAVAFIRRRHSPLLSFAIGWFLIGHALESTIIPLELVYEHRNYLPLMGPILAVSYYLLRPHGKVPVRAQAGVALALVLALATATAIRASQWESNQLWLLTQVRNHPDSPRNHALLAEDYARVAGKPGPHQAAVVELAREHYQRSLELRPAMASSLVGLLVLHSQHGLPLQSEWFSRLLQAVERDPVAASSVNAIGGLTECLVRGECAFGRADYEAIVEASQRNSHIGQGASATILSYAARYSAEVMKDYRAALRYEERAIAANPHDLILQFNRVVWLAELGQVQEAIDGLDTIAELDGKGAETRKLREWRRQLLALQQGATG
jgi:tetratricopeptide (TPR) repeat protein